MDRGDILFWSLFVVPGILLFVAAIYVGMVVLPEKIDQCAERGGVLVRTVQGHVCVDRAVLK